MKNFIPFHDAKELKKLWIPTDFTSSIHATSPTTYLGEIGCNGVTYFSSGILPPEMFMKLSPKLLTRYKKYWDEVMKLGSVKITSNLIAPWIDPISGDIYVVKCYYSSEEDMPPQLPPLPYDLIPSSKGIDLWSFGVLLFIFCSGGNSPFPTNSRTGHLSSLSMITNWGKDMAERVICGQIKNPIAQDILLCLLSSEQDRSLLSFDTVLSHPFFTEESDLSVETREMFEMAVGERKTDSWRVLQKNNQKSDNDRWLRMRQLTISHPIYHVKRRMLHSVSQLMKEVLGATDEALVMPLCFIALPYKLMRNKSGKLMPSTKMDSNVCEHLGRMLLNLSKACVFVHAMEMLLKSPDEAIKYVNLWANSSEANHNMVAKDMLSAIHLDVKFMDLATAYVSSIIAGREFFLSDPIFMARKLIHGVAKELIIMYAKIGKAYLYMVDEYSGIPVVPSMNDKTSCYPLEISKGLSKSLLKTLPHMQMCLLHVFGVEGGVSAMVKLFFEGAHPSVPPSWEAASQGLVYRLDRNSMVGQVKTLRVALQDMLSFNPSGKGSSNAGDEELRQIQAYFIEFDSALAFSDLKRICWNELSLWATESSLVLIEKESKFKYDISKFNHDYYPEKARAEMLTEKNKKIAHLKKAIENLHNPSLRLKKCKD